jgi:hypothetical protein
VRLEQHNLLLELSDTVIERRYVVLVGLANNCRIDDIVAGLNSTEFKYQVPAGHNETYNHGPDHNDPAYAMLL